MLLKRKNEPKAKAKWYPEKQIQSGTTIIWREEENCFEVYCNRVLIGIGDSEKEAYEIIEDYERTA